MRSGTACIVFFPDNETHSAWFKEAGRVLLGQAGSTSFEADLTNDDKAYLHS